MRPRSQDSLLKAFTAKGLAPLAALICGLVVAGSALAMEATHSDNVEATGPKTDMLFLAGKHVHVAVTSPEDIFAAGSNLRFDQGTADHVFAAGEVVTIAGDAARSFIAAGQTLSFDSGSAQNGVVAFGRDLTLRPTFKVGGSAVLMGRDLLIQAPIGRDLNAAGQTVTIDSAVTGNVRVEGNSVVIGPNARITGDLSYRADKIEISPQAVISGKRIVLPPEARDHHRGWKHHRTLAERIQGDLLGAAMFIVMALGLTALAPGLMARAGDMVGRNPLVAALVGFLTLIAGPVVAVILMITILGASLGAAVGVIVAALAFLGLAAAAAGLGMIARRLMGKGAGAEAPKLGSELGWTLLGAIVLCLLGAIPFVGGWVWLIACIVGVGAVAVRGRSSLTTQAA